jgi:hypothetical protein
MHFEVRITGGGMKRRGFGDVALDAFFDNFSCAGLFICLKIPKASDELKRNLLIQEIRVFLRSRVVSKTGTN